MVGAHQNLNGSRDLTTPLSGMVCHSWASTCYRQPISIKFEVSVPTHYEDIKGDKNVEIGWCRVVRVIQGQWI